MNPMFVSIDERTIDHLISALSFMKANGGVVENLGLLLVQSGVGLCVDDHETDIMALRCLKSSRDALRVILQVANDEIHILQKKCHPVTLQRGIQSLPDDILRNMFEIGDETYIDEDCDHTFPVALSHVNRRFRLIALSTPRIWTRLSNSLPSAELVTFLSRSKAADLSIFLDLWESLDNRDRRCNPETFLEIAKRHSDRWSSFTYHSDILDDSDEVIQHGYTHPALAKCRHLTLPRLKSLSCQKYNFEKALDIMPTPEAIFSTWMLPQLIRFDGENTLIEGGSIGNNVTCCKLQFVGDSLWDFRTLLRELESWSHLESFTLSVSHLERSPRVGHSSLQNVRSFSLKVGANIDVGFITNFFSLVKMPAMSSMAITFEDGRGTDVQQIIRTICATASLYSTLDIFTLDTSRAHGANRDTLHTVASNFPLLRDVSFRGTDIYGYHGYGNPAPPSWRKLSVEGATLRDWHNIEYFMGRMETSPHWASFKLQIADCSGLCGVIPKAKRRLGDKLEYGGQII